jgi:hypothetical protein
MDPRLVLPWWRRPRDARRVRLATAAGAFAMIVVATAISLLSTSSAPDSGPRAATPVPAGYHAVISEAAASCPSLLTFGRLAGQIMANTGFDASTQALVGRIGIAGLTEAAWRQWAPWPGAEPSDADASITALAHHMCDLMGRLRSSSVAKEPWPLALAADRTSVDDVTAVNGVPAPAQDYVTQVSAYAEVYAREPRSGSGLPGTPSTSQSNSVETPAPAATGSTSPADSPASPPSPGSSSGAGPTRPSAAPAPPAPSAAPPAPGSGPTGWISGFGGKCVHVAYSNSADGTQIEMYTCNNGKAEVMTMAVDGTIRALGKCIDLRSGSTSNGARAQLMTCNGSSSQQWRHSANGGLVNPGSKRCLEVANSQTYNGAPLQLWDCNGAANQKWTVPGR